MDLQVKDSSDVVSVADPVVGAAFNESLVHQVVVAYMAAGRAGTKAQKSRSQVAGGGKKPWRQKGTGRARAGTIRSPLWRGGGVTFAASPRDYRQKVNRKMWRGAMRCILSELVRQDRLTVVDKLQCDAPKTKDFLAKMKQWEVPSGLMIDHGNDRNFRLAARNVPGFTLTGSGGLDPVALVGAEHVVITVDALKSLEERLQ